MKIRPIGYVRNSADEKTDFEQLVSEIEMLPELEPGLYRIEEQEELDVIFCFHRKEGYTMKVHPHHDESLPMVGVFASRSPGRPNFLGLTRVKLLERKGNVLVVKGLDALNGTPVIDVKPATGWDHLYKNHK